MAVVFEHLGQRIIVDPDRMFGDPYLESCLHRPVTLASAVEIEGSIEAVMRFYRVERSAVEASLMYINSLQK